MRRQKDRATIAKAAGDDEMRREAQYKINLLTSKYAKLSKESGLPTKMERMKLAEFRKVSANTNKVAFNVKPGKDVTAVVDIDYVRSKAYSDKFLGISKKISIDAIISEKCTMILENRNGTYFEELFAIDANTGRVLTYIKGREKNSIQMSDKLKSILTKAKENSIIIVHNHPNSSTFSRTDIGTMIENKSIYQTIAAGHDGSVYCISGIPRDKKIIGEYQLSYTKNSKEWSDFTAREKAWDEVAQKWGFVYERR